LQTPLIDHILAQFGMTDANPISTPMEASIILSKLPSTPITTQEELKLKAILYRHLIGHLMYLAITTWPDISLTITKLSQFQDCYHFLHWLAPKHVLCYLAITCILKLRLGGHVAADLVSFSDASYTCCPDTAHSIGAYCFSLGESSIVSWCSWKQKTVAQSFYDAEYIAAFKVAHKAMWLTMLLTKLGLPP
jgi:hypothetical protein